MINKFKNTKAYMDNFSSELVKLLKIEIGRNRVRQYNRKNGSSTVNAPIDAVSKKDQTRSLRASLQSLVKERENSYSIKIEGNQYGLAVDKGRAPGRFPNIGDIADWIRNKPVSIRDIRTGKFKSRTDSNIKSLAYVIGRSISQKGIKPTNFISDAIEMSMGKLDKLGDAIGEDVMINVEDILLKAGYIKKGDNYIIEE